LKIVLDTNVFISGLLRPYGFPAAILRGVILGKVTLFYDDRLLGEYREVAARPGLKLDQARVESILTIIRSRGILVCAEPLRESSPDPDDMMFMEVAIAGKADCLVTGNVKHYPRAILREIRLATPREFCEILREGLS
jgi:putative PIN family toxin of toxin-antitoxin system